MSITTIKIRNRQYAITKDDQFLDNGDYTELHIFQEYGTVKLTKKMVKHINQFPQIEHKITNKYLAGCRLFSITAKERTT